MQISTSQVCGYTNDEVCVASFKSESVINSRLITVGALHMLSGRNLRVETAVGLVGKSEYWPARG